MRVITGQAKGVRLKAPEGLHTRPTTERVKEGMFSAVQFSLPGARVVDLFAGSGQLGIEALSRGAQSCVFVDNDKTAVGIIRENIGAAKLENAAVVRQNDVPAYLKSCGETFHLALLDAPYHGKQLEQALELVVKVMEPDGLILCETDRNTVLPEKVEDFSLRRTYVYSNTKVTMYGRQDA